MQLPLIINLLGYVVAVLAISATALVSTGKRRIARIGFAIWVCTNGFELFVMSYYYANVWASVQFIFYLVLASISVYTYKD